MNRQRLIVLVTSLQLHKTQRVLYHGLVLAYITLCPSTMGRRGTHPDLTPGVASSIIRLAKRPQLNITTTTSARRRMYQ